MGFKTGDLLKNRLFYFAKKYRKDKLYEEKIIMVVFVAVFICRMR